MKVILLAAGYATRLYPLTENFPKPLLQVGDKTIVDWLIDDIDQSGEIEEYFVVTNHKFAHFFDDWAKTKSQKITVVDDGTSTNETRLGAVCDIQLVIEKHQLKGDLLIMAGDNLLDFSLCEFLKFIKQHNSSCVMRFEQPDRQKLLKAGVVTIDSEDRIIRMTEKSPNPETHWICPPFYYYTQSDAQCIPQAIAEGCGIDAPGSFLAWLCQHSPVYAMKMPGSRYDIGNLKSYEEAKKKFGK